MQYALNSKPKFIVSESKFVKIPISQVAGFLAGLTSSFDNGYLPNRIVVGVSLYGDMATVEYVTPLIVEE